MAFRKRSSKSNTAAIVGLELDPSHIAAAEVEVNGRISVRRGAVKALRPGVLRDGEVNDVAALAAEIKAMWEENKLPKRVRLGIANQRIVVRTLDLPPLDEKALRPAVHVEAPDHIPMPIDEAILDYQSLGIVDTPAGPRARVVVVAVRREMADRYAAAAREAGLEVEGIDLSAFALVRSLGRISGAVLHVHVAGLINVAVARDMHCLFTRAAAGGMQSMVQTLCERRALTSEHSEAWLRHVGLVTPLGEVEGDPEVVATARMVLEEGVHQLADTVRNSLNFYRMQESAETVDRAILSGPATAIDGFADALAAALHMPVEVAQVAHSVDGDGDVDVSHLAVAAGLAVEAAPA